MIWNHIPNIKLVMLNFSLYDFPIKSIFAKNMSCLLTSYWNLDILLIPHLEEANLSQLTLEFPRYREHSNVFIGWEVIIRMGSLTWFIDYLGVHIIISFKSSHFHIYIPKPHTHIFLKLGIMSMSFPSTRIIYTISFAWDFYRCISYILRR